MQRVKNLWNWIQCPRFRVSRLTHFTKACCVRKMEAASEKDGSRVREREKKANCFLPCVHEEASWHAGQWVCELECTSLLNASPIPLSFRRFRAHKYLLLTRAYNKHVSCVEAAFLSDADVSSLGRIGITSLLLWT